MSSRVAVLQGVQTPRVASVPPARWTEADDAAFLASSYGLTPDEWQFTVLQGWLGRRVSGRWAAARCGLSVPRQNGKNGVLEVAELYKMVALGRAILHTAHEVKTARKAFLRLASFFENDRDHPELAGMCREVRRTNGQEAIVLTNGGSCEFIARSKGSGRGYTVDDLVCDEAQELSEDALAALLPTVSAAPSGDPQITFTGTPPSPSMDGAVWTRIRRAGVSGKDRRLCWHEWSVEVPGNLDDRSRWAATNPGLGIRLNPETVADERAAMTNETFGRERLGHWPRAGHLAVVDPDAWTAAATTAPPTGGPVAFGLDMNPDRTWLSIAAATRDDATVHVEVVKHRPVSDGTDWAVQWLAARWPSTVAVVVDGQSPARSLLPDLAEAKVRVTVTGAADMASACGQFYDRVTATPPRLTHFDQPVLTRALSAATKRTIGDGGGWGWARRGTDDVSPLVAATLAMHGVMTSRRRPGRRASVTVL
jgi:hypothetical protein